MDCNCRIDYAGYWEDLENYSSPDPLLFDWFGEKIDWEEIRKGLENSKKQGNLASGGLVHGFRV